MTQLIVARGESPGGSSDPWIEGTNLVTNGDFETADISLWQAYFFPETITRETVAPITGTGSLKLVTTANDKQGIVSDPEMPVTPGDRMRYRITLKGAGLVQTQITINNSDGFNPWLIIPLQTNAQIYTLEFIAPSDATEASVIVRTDSALVVTAYIDNIYFGVITPA